MMRACGCLGVLILVGMALFVYAIHPWILGAAGNALLRSDPLVKADAAVVLAGANTVRVREAAVLYQEQWVPRIILTRERPPEGAEELRKQGVAVPEMIDMSQRILEGLGVPESSIWRVETPIDSTDEEVRAVRTFLQGRNVKRLIVVTSKTHSRRSCLTFRHYLGADHEIICRYSRYDPFNPSGWWKKRRDIREMLFEWQKLLLYRLQFAFNLGSLS